MLRFYFNIEPDILTDSQFVDRVQDLAFVLDFEGRRVTTHGNIKMP